MILYIFFIGVLLTEEVKTSEASVDRRELYSDWSSWSSWSSCSRSCGSGIKTRTRFCQKRSSDAVDPSISRCYGDSRETKLCNTQECTEGLDYINYQCSQYNNREIANHFVSRWVALKGHTTRRNPCELRCQSVDSTIMYSFGKMTDGTACADNGRRVCINGRCLVVGCDDVVGSRAKEDMCRVCSGKNTTCVQVQQMYASSPQERLDGYSTVTVLPKGATNIHIEEHTRSNTLALKEDSNNEKIFNGDFSSQPSSGTFVGGTKFTYVRYHDRKVITALGPTSKAVTVMLLQVERGSSRVWYDYWIPKESQKTSPNTVISPPDVGKSHSPIAETHWQNPEERKHTNAVDPDVFDAGVGAHRSSLFLPSSTATPTTVASMPRKKKYKKKKQKLSKQRKKVHDSCPLCQHVKNQVEHFCKSHVVLRALIQRSEVYDGHLRYEVAVIESYKNNLAINPMEYIWSPNTTCPCPKLHLGKEYVIMAHNKKFQKNESRLVIDHHSFIRCYNNRRGHQLKNLRRFQNRKCNRTSLPLK